jgi:nicotinic acid phosphoribosyltransferase
MAGKAHSISVAQLSSAAHTAAKTALKETKSLTGVNPEPGIVVRPPWIIGIVIRNANLANLSEYQQVAQRVAAQVDKAAPGAGAQAPRSAVYAADHIVICGYYPVEPEFQTLE